MRKPTIEELQAQVKQLASERDAVVAENAALKDGATYFAYSPEYGFDYFKDKQSAIDTAQGEIDAYREDAEDGWSEDVQRVSWGGVIQQAQGFDAQGLHTSDSQHKYQTCDYRLVDAIATPATDAAIASLRAEGLEMLAAIASNECKRYKSINDRSGLRKWKSIVILCSDFAAQLRRKSEVQHD